MKNDQSAWIVIAKAPESLSYGVHDGYDDEPSNYYEFDSLVGNYKNLKPGDLVFVRGAWHLLGFGQIESITNKAGIKELRKCPNCLGRPESREKKMPQWRCMRCSGEFNTHELKIEMKEVTLFRATYSRSWQDANHPIGATVLKTYQANNDTQSAIRKLDSTKVIELIQRALGLPPSVDSFGNGLPVMIEGGHTITIAKRRRGQQEFRLGLLAAIGPSCFISGRNPEFVLEAAHIRGFAKHESHDLSGGVLLRRDLHSLFDRCMLRINPLKWQVEVSPIIQTFPNYQIFHLQRVDPPTSNPPNPDWLLEHYNQAALHFN